MSKKSKVITIVSVFLVLALIAIAIYFAVPKVLDKTWAEIFNVETTTETPVDDPNNDEEQKFVSYLWSYNSPISDTVETINIIYVSDFSIKYLNTQYSKYETKTCLLPGQQVQATCSILNPSRLKDIKIKNESIPFTILDSTHVQFNFTVPNTDFSIKLTINYEGLIFN